MEERSWNRTIRLIPFIAVAILSSAAWVVAQGVKAQPVHPAEKVEKGDKAEKRDVVRIRKFSGTGRQIIEKTPEYRNSVARGVKSAGEWAQITVTYDTAQDWIDELVFQYYVMTLKSDGGKKSYSLFKVTVKYIDVEKGRDHLSSVYLRPNTLKRYGDVVASAVEVLFEGRVVASETKSEIAMPEEWWTSAKVLENKDVTVRDGYLLDRAQTPFAFVNIDDYEASK